MEFPCANANHWGAIIAVCWLLHAVLEAWMGKTQLIKSGSVLELLWRFIRWYFSGKPSTLVSATTTILGEKTMLEGNELEQTYDNGAGKLIVDVTDKGEVKFSNVYAKDLNGYAKISNTTTIESNVFMIAYQATKKTGATWDEKVVEGLAKLLGIELAQAQAMAADLK